MLAVAKHDEKSRTQQNLISFVVVWSIAMALNQVWTVVKKHNVLIGSHHANETVHHSDK